MFENGLSTHHVRSISQAEDIVAILLEQTSVHLTSVYFSSSKKTHGTPWAIAADHLIELSSEKGPHVHLLLIMQVSRLE